MKKQHWTMLEAVVAAVCLLTLCAVTLPAIHAAAAQSKTALCLDNLRRIGGYVQIYADANGNYLPATRSCHQAGGDASFASAPGTLFRTVISPDKKAYDQTAPNELTRLFKCPEDATAAKRNQIGYVWWFFSKNCKHRKGDFVREMRSGEQAKRAIVTDFCKLPGLLDKPAYQHSDNTVNVLYADGAARTFQPADMEGIKGWDHLINFDDFHPGAGE